MCEPTTIMMGIAAISGAFAAKSSIDQGKYQQAVMNNNAVSEKYAADDAMARGAVEEQKQRDRARKVMGEQRAALAANGMDATTGSGSQILTDSAGFGEFDAIVARNNAMKQAYGFDTQADNLRAQGAAARKAGTNQAVGTALTAGSSIYSSGAKAGYWGK